MMGLAHRIIPTILCRGDVQVKGERFNGWRPVGVVEQSVRIHQARGVDELVLLDIAATPEGRGPDLTLVERLTAGCFMPLAVGGGIRKLQDVQNLLRAGADKVVIGSMAYEDPAEFTKITDTVGAQAVVFALDVRAPGATYGRCATLMKPLEAATYAIAYQALGAGEILLTSIDREGTMQGYDLDLISTVAKKASIPVIAHGGCKSYEDMRAAIEAGASAVAAGALFQFTDATPKGAARYLQSQGIEARV